MRKTCLLLLLLALPVLAQPRPSSSFPDLEQLAQVVSRVQQEGTTASAYGLRYLQQIDGDLRSYVTIQGGADARITLIEERWREKRGVEIIDQWIINIAPDRIEASHRELYERDSAVLKVKPHKPKGMEAVGTRILERFLPD